MKANKGKKTGNAWQWACGVPKPKEYEFPEPKEYEFPDPKEYKFPKPKKHDLRVELVRLDRLARSGAPAFLGWTRTQIYESSWHV